MEVLGVMGVFEQESFDDLVINREESGIKQTQNDTVSNIMEKQGAWIRNLIFEKIF